MTAKRGSGIPARGYKWEDAKPGNFLALKHGAWSPRIYEPIAAEIVAGVLAERPQLDRYRAALVAWADAEARCQTLRDYLAEVGMLDGGKVRPAMDLLLKLERQADKARQRLGLDPKADADLAKSTADASTAIADLDAVRAAGREALSAAESAEVLSTARDEGNDDDDR